jgi:sulfatase modifying factor 1
MKIIYHEEKINDTVFRLRYLPETIFDMGSENTEDALMKESPIHKVKLSPYYIGEHPVTQAIWMAVMGAENNPSNFVGEKKTVEQVSWEDIVGTEGKLCFLHRLNELTKETRPEGFLYRLPTEAEWENAARAGKDYEYAGSNKLKEVAWFSKNSHQESKNVGQKKANDFGLFDMSGNVWEWCHDIISEDFYANCVEAGKKSGTDYSLNPCNFEKGEFGRNRVIRGGSWAGTPQYCRVSYRGDFPPLYRNITFGFRLVLSSFSLAVS